LITGQIGGGAGDDYEIKWGRWPVGRRIGKYILERTFVVQFGSEVLSQRAFQIDGNKILTFPKLELIYGPINQQEVFRGNVAFLPVPHSTLQIIVYI
jgi:hypothetical protein